MDTADPERTGLQASARNIFLLIYARFSPASLPRWCAMSFEATKWPWSIGESTPLSPAQRLVLLTLANRHNGKTGACYPALKTIMRATGHSNTGVIDALDAAKAITVDRSRRRNTYVLNLPIGEPTSPIEPDRISEPRSPIGIVDDSINRWPSLTSSVSHARPNGEPRSHQSGNNQERTFQKDAHARPKASSISIRQRAEDAWLVVEVLARDVSIARERASPESNAAVDMLGGWYPPFRGSTPFSMTAIKQRFISAYVNAESTAP